MTPELAIEILRQLITTSLLIISPILGTAIIIGVSVSLLQSITSIQEQTLSFVPKIVAIGAILIVSAPWILRTIMQFTIAYFSKIPEMVR